MRLRGGVPVPNSQFSSLICTSAPRGVVSGKTSASPSSDASLKNPAFHGLREVGMPASHEVNNEGSRGILGMGHPSKIVQDREFQFTRGLWDENIEGALESPKSPSLRHDVKTNWAYNQRKRSAWLASNVNLVMEPPKTLLFWTCWMLAMMRSME